MRSWRRATSCRGHQLRLLAALRALVCVAGFFAGVQLLVATQQRTADFVEPASALSLSDPLLGSSSDAAAPPPFVRDPRSVRQTVGNRAVESSPELDSHQQRRRLLFVGVMTADVFLESRAVAVHDTWASTLASDADGAHAFFTSQKSSGPEHLPIVRLRGVTDQYPPQKKSFMMFKYMYEHFGHQYEWFMRADDDVYVRTERLARLLRGVNSSQPKFIGQAGQGAKSEIGLLSLQDEDNFCMGGPGIVISHATLERIYPHIRYCLANMYTTHEDVEIGRCVKRFTGVSCLWNYEMKEIFYNEYGGTNAFLGSLKKRSFTNAITLHPIKSPPLLYRIHHFFLSEKIKQAQMMKVIRNRDILRSTEPENVASLSPLTRRHGLAPMLNKREVSDPEDVLPWMHIGHRFSLNAAKVYDPRISAALHLREGIRDATGALMDYMLSFTQARGHSIQCCHSDSERGRSLTLQDHNYGYHRVDPLYGVDMVLDLVLKYIRFRGKPTTQKVRRHAYMQQVFGESEVRLLPRREGVVVNLVVGLAGKLTPFLKFCDNFEKMGLRDVRVVFVYHENADKEHSTEIVHKLQYMQDTYGEAVAVVTSSQPFDRSTSLMLGVSVLSDDDLVLLTDIDILPTSTALDNVRNFVVQGKQVYFPVVFSEYDPLSSLMEPDLAKADHFTVDAGRGKFRYFGFGVGALYKSDLKAVGGLNEGIHGWGKEDVDLMDHVLRHPANYTVIRAAEPGMVHVFHKIQCAESLSDEQKSMCHGTQHSFMAAKRALAWQVCVDERILPFARHLPKSTPRTPSQQPQQEGRQQSSAAGAGAKKSK